MPAKVLLTIYNFLIQKGTLHYVIFPRKNDILILYSYH